MSRLTDADLSAMEKCMQAATPGPWTTTHIFNGEEVIAGVQTSWDVPRVGSIVSGADAEFITAARNTIPALLADIRDQRQEITESRDLLNRLSRLPFSLYIVKLIRTHLDKYKEDACSTPS